MAAKRKNITDPLEKEMDFFWKVQETLQFQKECEDARAGRH